eukprot:gnl/TRDRNA2_/TRDRNA2_60136_c0_seq1.p1 gnl/TRDRNA2_/TRDRNA2_60136_c0~~gnl/TRDRNA2_/TRDRNA2_60136_c0_seq1.p1  ORF type:complete len:239 (+),score=48.39 gnl/TRDRNA2_/TRDRNA2_60136_c0_seq1:37-753(+)
MLHLSLEFHTRGLLVTGDTFDAKDILKINGGRWDAMLKGWIFPFDGKQDLLEALRAAATNIKVDDGAKVELSMASCEQGILVSGSTFPVKALLKNEGGTWNATLKGWIFQGLAGAELAKTLRRCPDVGTVTDASREPVCRAVALRGKPTPHGRLPVDGDHTVIETGKRTSKSEQRADGSKSREQTAMSQRRVSCKRTGVHLQTESVTKRQKTVETKSKVVETKTIVLKRVRSKKNALG